MNSIRFNIIVIFILFSIINNTPAKEKVDNYSVYAKLPLIGEVEVQKIETELSIADSTFEYSYFVAPSKVVDFFDKKITSGYILGSLKNNSVNTDHYFLKTEKDDFSRIIEFIYINNVIHDISINPSYDISKITGVTDKMIMESIDPVTMFFKITNFEFINECNKTIKVYDGKRRYDLELSNPKKTDKAYICILKHQKIAGYKPEKIKENKIYISELKFLINENQSYEFSEVSLRNNNTELIIRKK